MHYIGKGEKDLFVVGVLVEIGFKLPKLVPIVQPLGYGGNSAHNTYDIVMVHLGCFYKMVDDEGPCINIFLIQYTK